MQIHLPRKAKPLDITVLAWTWEKGEALGPPGFKIFYFPTDISIETCFSLSFDISPLLVPPEKTSTSSRKKKRRCKLERPLRYNERPGCCFRSGWELRSRRRRPNPDPPAVCKRQNALIRCRAPVQSCDRCQRPLHPTPVPGTAPQAPHVKLYVSRHSSVIV